MVVALLITLAAGGRSGYAQDRFADIEIKATHVAGSVYMLEGGGGNIGVSVGPDGVFVIDDQFAPLAEKIKAAIAKLDGGKIKFVLNTHWHGDHVGGNAEFGREALILAHTNVRKRLATEQTLFGRKIDPLPREALPVITFDESLSIHFNNEEIRIVHFPGGHTDGDSVVFFTGSKVVHMGDLIFAGTFPFVDLEHGGDVVGYTENIDAIIGELPKDAQIIPGHGPLSNLDDLKAYHRMLVETTAVVRQRIAVGKTEQEIRTEGLPDEWSRWSGRFITTDEWLGIVYRSLTKKNRDK
jgi:glyoxylase-like metal-dependent hydrolase (beta-lactamase superfamily II)